MSWEDEEQGKEYNKQYYQQHKGYFKEYNRRYRAEHREELQAKRKEYKRRYEEKKAKGEKEEKQLSDAEKEQRENMRAVSKEEWLERYGYPMGDTSDWENWAGWDRRIRRGEE